MALMRLHDLVAGATQAHATGTGALVVVGAEDERRIAVIGRQEAPRRTSPLRRRCGHRSDRVATRRSPSRCTGRGRFPEYARSSAVWERKKRWKSRSRSSSGMPMPVSDTSDRRRRRAARGGRRAAASRRELDRIRDEVVEELSEPHRLPVDRGNRVGLCRQRHLRARRPRPGRGDGLCDDLAEVDAPRARLEPPSCGRAVKSRSETGPGGAARCGRRSRGGPRFSSSGSGTRAVSRRSLEIEVNGVRSSCETLETNSSLRWSSSTRLLVLVGQQLLRLFGFASRDPLSAPRPLDRAHEPGELGSRTREGEHGAADAEHVCVHAMVRDPLDLSASRARPATHLRAG